jgi:hypothetical protein
MGRGNKPIRASCFADSCRYLLHTRVSEQPIEVEPGTVEQGKVGEIGQLLGTHHGLPAGVSDGGTDLLVLSETAS